MLRPRNYRYFVPAFGVAVVVLSRGSRVRLRALQRPWTMGVAISVLCEGFLARLRMLGDRRPIVRTVKGTQIGGRVGTGGAAVDDGPVVCWLSGPMLPVGMWRLIDFERDIVYAALWWLLTRKRRTLRKWTWRLWLYAIILFILVCYLHLRRFLCSLLLSHLASLCLIIDLWAKFHFITTGLNYANRFRFWTSLNFIINFIIWFCIFRLSAWFLIVVVQCYIFYFFWWWLWFFLVLANWREYDGHIIWLFLIVGAHLYWLFCILDWAFLFDWLLVDANASLLTLFWYKIVIKEVAVH